MQFDTIPGIARACGFADWQVRHIVKTRGIIPCHRVGDLGVQLFGPSEVNFIIGTLLRVARRHRQQKGENSDTTRSART